MWLLKNTLFLAVLEVFFQNAVSAQEMRRLSGVFFVQGVSCIMHRFFGRTWHLDVFKAVEFLRSVPI
jgi:hypothetical protein